ncbi:MAG: hypothetical protein KJ011_05835 [Burkholderiaceae bacterium]|nr:hypothetical protein [Burkholderiaceae bacterium]
MHTRSRLPELLGLATVLGLCYRTVCRVHEERLARRPRAAPEHIQTWEGEGGGVPVGTHRTAAQVEPAPPEVRSDRPGGE